MVTKLKAKTKNPSAVRKEWEPRKRKPVRVEVEKWGDEVGCEYWREFPCQMGRPLEHCTVEEIEERINHLRSSWTEWEGKDRCIALLFREKEGRR